VKCVVAAALIVGGLIGTPATLDAHDRNPQQRADRQGPMTFSGSCAFSGTVEFQPPLTITAQPARDLASARGSCSGTLTDRNGRTHQLDATPVDYLATDTASDVSCALSAGATGTGELAFRSGELRFKLSETRVGAAAGLSLTGVHEGSATGAANVNTSANPIQVIDACAGTGLARAPVDIHIQTTPTISG
jgi:hypothetical protein